MYIYLLIFLSLILKISGNIRNLFFVTFCMLLFYPACNKDELNPGDSTDETVSGEVYYRESKVAVGYSASSVNAVVFRRNSLVTFDGSQYIAFYNSSKNVVIGKRKLDSDNWLLNPSQYAGMATDAHNVISIMVDGDGYLHVSWDHHGHPLRYAKGRSPGSIELGVKESMTGSLEDRVTYPEFYKLNNGDLLFFYRDGGSGNGNLVLNRYRTSQKKWERVHNNLLDGEGVRNAYWQIWVDPNDEVHLSWVWRESGNASTNRNIGYAKSTDGGVTWKKSTGENCTVPMKDGSHELVWDIPMSSNLINTTSMTTDSDGNPYIATYYKPSDDNCTNCYLFYLKDGKWMRSKITSRKLDFDLSGGGTLRIPLSRPLITCEEKNGKKTLIHIYRDEELGNQVIFSKALVEDQLVWESKSLSGKDMGQWEPTFDSELWKEKQELHLYGQYVQQISGDPGNASSEPSRVSVFEVQLERLNVSFITLVYPLCLGVLVAEKSF
jgi:hypothetical protein